MTQTTTHGRRLVRAFLRSAALLAGAASGRADELTDLVGQTIGPRVRPDARYELIARAPDHAVVGVTTAARRSRRSSASS